MSDCSCENHLPYFINLVENYHSNSQAVYLSYSSNYHDCTKPKTTHFYCKHVWKVYVQPSQIMSGQCPNKNPAYLY